MTHSARNARPSGQDTLHRKETKKTNKLNFFTIHYSPISLFFCTFAPDMDQMEKTNAQFEQAMSECRSLFEEVTRL